MINSENIKNNPQFNSISADKFQIVKGRTNIHDKAPETKPVSYLKDAWNRFKKNKGSVVASVIILILVLFAIFGPIFSPYTVAYSDPYFKFCLPKSTLSETLGWDFWDGCKEDVMNLSKFNYYNAIGVESIRLAGEENGHSVIKNQHAEILERDENGNPISFKVRFDTYTQYGCVYMNLTAEEYANIQAYQDEFQTQVLYPITQVNLRPNSYDGAVNDANYWMLTENDKGKAKIIVNENGEYIPIYQGYRGHNNKGVTGDLYTSNLYEAKTLPDGTKLYEVLTTSGWKIVDENGQYYAIDMTKDQNQQGSYYVTDVDGSCLLKLDNKTYTLELDENGKEQRIPLRKYEYGRKNQTGYEVRVNYYEYYTYYHTYVLKDGIKEPVFLFGSSDFGHDIFTQLAGGARFSFLFAIAVSVVNMLVGTIYGAIEGYYGGAADIIMERICDILGSIPTMIVITLLKMHMRGTAMQQHGHLIILFITYFATGWMGMAGRVRMQFYRFKNQEYVLAARTLGARDRRIMFKHIFPNSLGTIVTGSVLVIPGMIFSESSLSYLGIINLSTGNLTSVGTLLAKADPYLADYPYMMVFPAVFISLLMLSFNLFGNGLRDAFNPSLRGAEE